MFPAEARLEVARLVVDNRERSFCKLGRARKFLLRISGSSEFFRTAAALFDSPEPHLARGESPGVVPRVELIYHRGFCKDHSRALTITTEQGKISFTYSWEACGR